MHLPRNLPKPVKAGWSLRSVSAEKAESLPQPPIFALLFPIQHCSGNGAAPSLLSFPDAMVFTIVVSK